MNKILRLSPTSYLDFRDCGFKYYLKYILKIATEARSANLIFGGVAADVINRFFQSQHMGIAVDLPSLFRDQWNAAIDREIIDYSTTADADNLLDIGLYMMDKFPEVWRMSGMTPVVTEAGDIVAEKKIVVNLGHGVHFSTKIDVMALDMNTGDVCIIDQKTPASASDPDFALVAEQLTGYNMVGELVKEELGIPGVDKVGFQELIKRKIPAKGRSGKGPEVLLPHLVPARSSEQIAAFKNRLLNAAADIRKGRFEPNYRMAHNSPCDLCDFKNLCFKGSKEGLVFPENCQLKLVA